MKRHAFERILVPTDFGPSAEQALQLAMRLARETSAELQILHVYAIPVVPIAAGAGMYPAAAAPYPLTLLDAVRDSAQQQLDALLEKVRLTCPTATARLQEGDARREILATAEEWGADLIVIGTHGRTGVARVLLGSVAEHVVRHSRIPVLTVRAND